MTKWYRVLREKNNLVHDEISGIISSFFENGDKEAAFFIVKINASEAEHKKMTENDFGILIDNPF